MQTLFLLGRLLSWPLLLRGTLLRSFLCRRLSDYFLSSLRRCGSLDCLNQVGVAVARYLFFQGDLQVGDTPLIAVGAAHRRRSNTLHTRTVVGYRALDVQPVHVNIQALLGADVVGILHR